MRAEFGMPVAEGHPTGPAADRLVTDSDDGKVADESPLVIAGKPLALVGTTVA